LNQNFKIIFMGKDLQVENTYFVSGAKRGLSNQFQPEWPKVNFCIHQPAGVATKELHVVSSERIIPSPR
jgi:hypothetical protein